MSSIQAFAGRASSYKDSLWEIPCSCASSFTVGPYKRSVAGIAELPDTLRLIRPTNPVQQQPLAHLWEPALQANSLLYSVQTRQRAIDMRPVAGGISQ